MIINLQASPLKDRPKLIADALYQSRGRLRYRTDDPEVVAGVLNLTYMDSLKNKGTVKRLLNQYMKHYAVSTPEQEEEEELTG